MITDAEQSRQQVKRVSCGHCGSDIEVPVSRIWKTHKDDEIYEKTVHVAIVDSSWGGNAPVNYKQSRYRAVHSFSE